MSKIKLNTKEGTWGIAIFVVQLIILQPIWLFFKILALFANFQRLEADPTLVIALVSEGLIVTWGIYVSVKLMDIHPSALNRTLPYVLVAIIVLITIPLLIASKLSIRAPVASEFRMNVPPYFIHSFLFILWYIYFKYSKKIKSIFEKQTDYGVIQNLSNQIEEENNKEREEMSSLVDNSVYTPSETEKVISGRGAIITSNYWKVASIVLAATLISVVVILLVNKKLTSSDNLRSIQTIEDNLKKHDESATSSNSAQETLDDQSYSRGIHQVLDLMKNVIDESNTLQSNYSRELDKVGWNNLLTPSRLEMDYGFQDSYSTIESSKEVVRFYKSKDINLAHSIKDRIYSLNISEASKKTAVDIYVTTWPQLARDSSWVIDENFLLYAEKMIGVLSEQSNRWHVEKGVLIFKDEDAANSYNYYFQEMHTSAKQQDALIARENSRRDEYLKKLKSLLN